MVASQPDASAPRRRTLARAHAPPEVRGGAPRRHRPEDSTDADQAAVLPPTPRRLPARPLDEVPVLRGDAVQQAARQGPAGLPELRPPLPAVGRRPPRAPPRPRHVRRARRRAPVGRPARVRRPEALPRPDRGRPARDRDAGRGGLGHRHDRRPAGRDLRHGLRVHGRLDGRGRRREGDARRGARPRPAAAR